jgi:glucose 1-dehydrogenase
MAGVDLRGCVALVTGASLGIGRATAIALGKAGAKVGVNYRSNHEKAQEVVDEIRKAGSDALLLPADVADQPAVEKMVAETAAKFGKLDIAVSNAAYSDRDRFFEADMAGFRRTVDVNVGAFI